MIRVMLFDPRCGVTTGDEGLLEQWSAGNTADARSTDQRIWIDLEGVDSGIESELLRRHFGLHPIAIQDAQRDRHPPKLEEFDRYSFLLLKGLHAEAGELEFQTIQIALFAGDRFLVSRHSGASRSLDRLWVQLESDANLFGRGSWALLLQVTRYVVERYLGVLMQLESRLDEIEEEMLTRPRDELLHELTRYRSELTRVRRIFAYHEQIFARLKNAAPAPIRSAGLEHELNDVYEQLERASSLTALYYGLVTDLSNSYLALASHRLNGIMKVLTIITAIFVPLSFLAGIYGMNFEHMPELASRYAYFVLLGIMAMIVVTLLSVFRRKQWL